MASLGIHYLSISRLGSGYFSNVVHLGLARLGIIRLGTRQGKTTLVKQLQSFQMKKWYFLWDP